MTGSEGEQDIYAAVGAGGQFIFVIPEYQMVVGVTSDVRAGERWGPHLLALLGCTRVGDALTPVPTPYPRTLSRTNR